MGMVGCEDVCEISDGFDLLLGLDCEVGLWWPGRIWWRDAPVVFIF